MWRVLKNNETFLNSAGDNQEWMKGKRFYPPYKSYSPGRVIAKNGYSKIWRDTSRHINRYTQINDTLFRQRITAGSGTDLS